jgi:methionyl-tRNA formyltransferase
VLLEQRIAIGASETGGQLHDRLAALGAQTLSDGIGLLRAGLKPVARAQSAVGVTYARKLDKAEARLDWSRPAGELARTVRAFNPWPTAETTLGSERVRVHAATAIPRDGVAAPGAVIAAARDGIDIACGEGALRIGLLQREGGKAITAADFLNAHPQLKTP